ncbi:lysoplasmalogenase [Oryzihumus leptocrescens]|uniref:Putative membrane protein YhhN n=1 Tax=Oryzihumus leptocrescens TaxID=297536 RepID=A0A542ZKY6_9MICO|nr:lysoplasmalogenase [Oryzihumus leptocrescens]TQL61006.1 putative membrane protein YhhN [Oryzihumus leptocrescens]
MVPALAVALAATALLDWHAVCRDHRRVERVAKPLVMVLLGALALALGAGGTGTGWLLAAIALGCVGDVFLLGDGEPRFLAGLTAFLLGHLAYVVAFVSLGFDPRWALAGAAVVLLDLASAGRGILVSAARQDRTLGGAVAAYMLVIAAMTVTAWGTGRPLVALGAVVFVASDTVLALDRFVRPRPGSRVLVMVTYHVGQVLMVLGALR